MRITAIVLFLAAASACSSAPHEAVLRDIEEESLLADFLRARGVAFSIEGPDLVVPRSKDAFWALVEALTMLRSQLRASANNIANVDTVGVPVPPEHEQGVRVPERCVPYRRKVLRIEEADDFGSPGFSIVEDPGSETLPAPINPIAEMVEMMKASHQLEEGLAALERWRWKP